MNTLEASEFLGIPANILAKMRYRPTSTLQAGPPFEKKYVKGKPTVVYKMSSLKAWLKMRSCLLTAGEAAELLGVSRDEILNMVGSYEVAGGNLVVYPTRNVYLFQSQRRLNEIKKKRA